MAKLAVLLTTLALFLFLANASIRTAITVENDDENPWGHQEGSCQQQIMKQDYLKHCQNYMEEQCSGGRCDYNRERINSCCQQLQKLDRQCRCTGLKQAMQQQMGGDMGKVMQEMQQMAESVLSKCNMEPRKCDMPYENPWGTKTKTGGCSRQIEQQDYLRHCQKYMEGQCSCSCSGCRCNTRAASRHLDSCCEELQNLDRQCRCTGLKQAIEEQMEQGKMERGEMRSEMYQMADKILSKCNMEPRKCDMPYRGMF